MVADLRKAKQEYEYFSEHRHTNRIVIQKYIELFGDPPKGVPLILLKSKVWYRLMKSMYSREEWKAKSELVHNRYRAAQDLNLSGFDDNSKLLMKCDMMYNEGEGQLTERRMEKMALKFRKDDSKKDEKKAAKDRKPNKRKGEKIGRVLGKNLGLSIHQTWVYGLGIKKLEGKQLVKFMEKEYPGRKTDWEKDTDRREKKYKRGGYDKDIKELKALKK